MIQKILDEGRLIRGQWAREEDGLQLLCLYTALMNDPKARPNSCPASVCPEWLAHLLPWIDDSGTEDHWATVVARVARLAPRFGELPPETEWRVRSLCVQEAMRHTDDAKVLRICATVVDLCERRGRGESVLDSDFEASAAAEAEAEAAAAAARAAADRLIDAILDEVERSLS